MTFTTEQAVLDRTARRYRCCGRFTRHYVASKLKRDPVHLVLLALGRREGGFGTVVDLGCGRGQIAVALLEAGVAQSAIGVDCSGWSLKNARQAATGLKFTGELANLAVDPIVPPCDTVLLIDILYMLGTSAAMALLRAAAAAAQERILIRTLDPNRGMRSLLTLATERLGRQFWPHAGAKVDPIPVAALLAALRDAGFRPDAPVPCWQGTPFANVLIAARRLTGAVSASP